MNYVNHLFLNQVIIMADMYNGEDVDPSSKPHQFPNNFVNRNIVHIVHNVVIKDFCLIMQVPY